MNTQIKILIGFFAGLLIGILSVFVTNQTPHMQQHSIDGSHSHEEMISLGEDQSLAVSIEEARVSGQTVDIRLNTENFSFSPENANGVHIPGEGHAHVYVDGVKVGRAYSEWYHISGLPYGSHEITVTLSSNDHRLYSAGGEVVSDSVSVEIQ